MKEGHKYDSFGALRGTYHSTIMGSTLKLLKQELVI
jgi:hypothetical protein